MYTYYRHTNNKNTKLAHSHYSDPAFDGRGADIYRKDNGQLRWEYQDRLRQWDSDKYKLAVSKSGGFDTAKNIEIFLQFYFNDDSIKIACVRSGTQQFNGYPWYAYGFTQDS